MPVPKHEKRLWWIQEPPKPPPSAVNEAEMEAHAKRVAESPKNPAHVFQAEVARLQTEIKRVEQIANEARILADETAQQVVEENVIAHANRSDDYKRRWQYQSFHFTFVSRYEIYLQGGSLRLHGSRDPIPIADKIVTLTGSECWVFVKWPKNDPDSVSIDTAPNEPKTEPKEFRVPLYHFVSVGSNDYRLLRDRRFDINFGTPLV